MPISFLPTSEIPVEALLGRREPSPRNSLFPSFLDFQLSLIMPASSRASPVRPADDIWHQHEAQIKELYQNQRKTLEEVKHLMEEEGFPKKP